MRVRALFAFLAIAIPCHAEDPLETLNTVQDTLSTMEQALKLRTVSRHAALAPGIVGEKLPVDTSLYFTSNEDIGANGWVVASPCTEELARAQTESQSCVGQTDGTVTMAGHVWKSRLATPADLEVGAVVVVQDASGGAWYVTRITDLSEEKSGYVATALPYRAPVKGLRVVE